MALTMTYADVLAVIETTIHRNVMDKMAPVLCNLATDLIWNAYDWRETLEDFPPFYLIPNEQDHGAPFSAVPSDYLGLRKVFLTQLTSAPPNRTELRVLKDIRLTPSRGLPHAIGFDQSKSAFRVFPRVPENIGSPYYFIEGTYKKRPTKVTAANLHVALPFDDLYFNVWIDAMKWAGYNLAGDQRAGGVSIANGGQRIYAGQLAITKDAIQSMAENEGFNDGDVAIAPSDPLIVQGGYYGNLW